MKSLTSYAVHWVDFEPVRGAEMAKARPAVIVSRDELNRHLKTVTVCPLTTSIHPGWRTRLRIELDGKVAEIAGDQIRTVSVERIGTKLGSLLPDEVAKLKSLLTELYGQ